MFFQLLFDLRFQSFGGPCFENHIPALNVAANIPKPKRFEALSEFIHFDDLRTAYIDRTQENYILCHGIHSSSLTSPARFQCGDLGQAT